MIIDDVRIVKEFDDSIVCTAPPVLQFEGKILMSDHADVPEGTGDASADEAIGIAMASELFEIFRSKPGISSVELSKFEEGMAPLLAFVAKPSYATDLVDAFMDGLIDGKTFADLPSPVFDARSRKSMADLEDRYGNALAKSVSAEQRAKADLDAAQRAYEETVARRERAERFWGVLALMKVMRAFRRTLKGMAVPMVVEPKVPAAPEVVVAPVPDKLEEILSSYPEGGTSVFKRIERERSSRMREIIDELMATAQGRIILREGICQGIERIGKKPGFRDYALNKAEIEGL